MRSREYADAGDERLLRALANPTRRRILRVIGEGELRAGDVAALFSMSRPAVSKHLRVLREAGLLVVRVSGRERWYAITPGPLKEVAGVVREIETLLRGGLHRLGEHLAATGAAGADAPRGRDAQDDAHDDGEGDDDA